jgi:PKD repeat protein
MVPTLAPISLPRIVRWLLYLSLLGLIFILLAAFPPAAAASRSAGPAVPWPAGVWGNPAGEAAPVGSEWPDCHFGCTASDVTVTRFWLADAAGNPLPNTCTPGDPVTAYIWAAFHSNASSERTAVILLARITAGGATLHDFYADSPAGFCSLDSIPASGDSQRSIYGPFSWTCGQALTVRDAVVSWDIPGHGGGTCATAERSCPARGTSKCWQGPAITVQAPLIADFAAPPACVGSPTVFKDKTTGGTTPFAWTWSFGDGDGETVQDPIHTYAAAGLYTAGLSVTDSGVPPATDSQSHPVTVLSDPVARFTFSQFGASAQFTDTSHLPANYACPEPAPWSFLWDFGDGTATSTLQNPAHDFNTNLGQNDFAVTFSATDPCGCTAVTSLPFHADVTAVSLSSFSAEPDSQLRYGETLAFLVLMTAAGLIWAFYPRKSKGPRIEEARPSGKEEGK